MLKFIVAPLAILLAGFVFVSVASAQNFNIDFGGTNPAPASSFGAASQIGFWNSYSGGLQSGFVDIGGNNTGVSIQQVGPGFVGAFPDPTTFGNDELLLDDQITSPVTDIYTVTGLTAGTYNIYSYTWTFGALSTGFTVNSQPQQIVGGTWTGSYIQGQTYAFNTVTLATNQPLIIQVDSIGGALGAMTGLQIVTSVPSPVCAGPAVVMLFGFICARRRA